MVYSNPESCDSAEKAERAQEMYFLGSGLLDEGKFAESAAILQKSAVLSPHYKTFELLGESLLHLNRHTEAIPPLAAAILLHTQPRAAALLAAVFLALGDYIQARNMAELAIERNPSYGWPQELLQQIEVADKTSRDAGGGTSGPGGPG